MGPCDGYGFLQSVQHSIGMVSNLFATVETTDGVNLVLNTLIHVHAVDTGVPENERNLCK